MFNDAVPFMMCLRHVKLSCDKVLLGFRLIPCCLRSIVACHIIIAVTFTVGICQDGDEFMSREEGIIMASSTLLHSTLPTSFSGTSLFFRRVSLSGVTLVLLRMCVWGVISLVRVYGAEGLVGQLGWVSLTDWLCYSWEDISKGGMVLGHLNCVDAGKEVFFLVLQTVTLIGPCFDLITWIHVYSPLIHHIKNTKATQHTKA